MKIWLKFLIGSFLGALLGWFLPSDNQTIMSALIWLAEIGIRIGRYMTAPILIFSLTIAVYELQEDNLFWPLIVRTFLIMILSTFFVIGVGIMVMYLFPAIRIPILTGEQVAIVSLDPLDNIIALFPSNMFSVLGSDGVYFFPMCIVAFFIGMGIFHYNSFNRSISKPLITLADSLSHVFYYIEMFFAETLGLVMIILSAYWSVRYRAVLQEDIFWNVILLLGILSGILGFILLPLFFCLCGGGKNPWKMLRDSLVPALTSFFSGDINFTIPITLYHLKENLGVRRRASAVTVPLFATFGRAGSAMVAVIALIVVIQSYSSLKLNLPDIFFIGIKGCLISFFLSHRPGDGAYIALAVLCINYGKGFEAGYLVFKPLAFYLIAAGVFLDVMITCFATYSLAKMNGFQKDNI